MEPSIFTKIILGEIPAHKVYEDDHTFAFLDINPTVPGHTLVIPKTQVNRLEDLPDLEYQALMDSTRTIMRHFVEVLGQEYRACLKVEGFIVPHAHVHVLPCRTPEEFMAKPTGAEPDHHALAQMAEKLKF
jgi:histidine triad (HIT) family protein